MGKQAKKSIPACYDVEIPLEKLLSLFNLGRR